MKGSEKIKVESQKNLKIKAENLEERLRIANSLSKKK